MDPLAGLAGYAHGVVGGNGQLVFDLDLHLVGMRRGQIDLVDRRDDVEVGVHGEAGVGDRLGLDPLRRVDHQDGALARGEASADLIGEVDVSRGIDQVELIGLPVVGVIHDAHGVGLDGDAALPLDVHRVEQLRRHVALLDGPGEFENAVGDGGLPVVDMGHDREVPDV